MYHEVLAHHSRVKLKSHQHYRSKLFASKRIQVPLDATATAPARIKNCTKPTVRQRHRPFISNNIVCIVFYWVVDIHPLLPCRTIITKKILAKKGERKAKKSKDMRRRNRAKGEVLWCPANDSALFLGVVNDLLTASKKKGAFQTFPCMGWCCQSFRLSLALFTSPSPVFRSASCDGGGCA